MARVVPLCSIHHGVADFAEAGTPIVSPVDKSQMMRKLYAVVRVQRDKISLGTCYVLSEQIDERSSELDSNVRKMFDK